MSPKFLDLLFKDDRMFVMEISPVEKMSPTSNDPPPIEWAVITRRNVHGYPPHRSDCFLTRLDAVAHYKQAVVMTPRVSLDSKPPDVPPSIEDYTCWLADEGLYDPLLNPDAPVK